MTKSEFLGYLHDGDFRQLFLDCFWDNPTSRDSYRIAIGENEYTFREVAQKGLRVYLCKVSAIPDSATRRLIDSRLRKISHEYFAIYVATGEPMHHLWSVPVRTVDKRQLVTIEYDKDDQAAFLVEKMNAISFSLDEDPTIIDVVSKVNAAFLVNSADVTKQFYQSFRKQHELFVKGIENIAKEEDREWYASVMLNRLMFCYFIQKKGFLDFDEDYLGHKLKWVQQEQGRDKFYGSFYKRFLKELFSDGLDGPVSGRSAAFRKKYGKIPYLNGGMFSRHRIEKENAGIDIPDIVFERLFDFFDQWRWHLDSRITATGRDINPDVLGYIFEQYINDRAQMGAYYTKEDITEYIGRNCIVPWLLNRAGVDVASALGRLGDSEAWRNSETPPNPQNSKTPRSDSNPLDRYIFPAVRKGVDLPLPPEVEKGVSVEPQSTLRARRAEWNKPAASEYALPTEIWRETVARRQRCEALRAKIANGEIRDVNDFITFNLDIRAFAEDLVRATPDHLFVLHFYKALREITVLDPTCGSGAFLFAALNILEPLYEACLDRMEEFHAANDRLFKDELAEFASGGAGGSSAASEGRRLSRPPNREYFICKSIILRNLYGVDIMHEAVEIARLRLFLKMVAVVDVNPADENLGLDPLPDIDFNICCGNTLVGYATEEAIRDDLSYDLFAYNTVKKEVEGEMAKASMAFDYFQREQLNLQGDHLQLMEAKAEINTRRDNIRKLLNDHLYASSGSIKKKELWLKDTQPFHWLTEFYPIMHGRGGFDVIIGNPPYVEYSKVKEYKIKDYKTESCGNLYAFVLERCLHISHKANRMGMIVQLPIVCTDRMKPAQDLLLTMNTWTATFDDRPGKLFDDLEHIRACIFLLQHGAACLRTTRYNKWDSIARSNLFQLLTYHLAHPWPGSFPKLGDDMSWHMLGKLSKETVLGQSLSKTGVEIFYHNAPQYFTRFTDFIPYFKSADGKTKISSHVKTIYATNAGNAAVIVATLNSSLFYWFNTAHSNCRDLTLREILGFPLNLKEMAPPIKQRLIAKSKELMADYKKKSFRKQCFYKATGKVEYDEYYPNLSKPIIDEIDELLAKHYGFTEEELDFIINYDIKYRMGDELNAGE